MSVLSDSPPCSSRSHAKRQTLATLANFNGDNGAVPQAALLLGTDGNFYGTTAFGGANNGGTVFKITAGGTLTTLYGFSGGADGGQPSAGLMQASDGNLYGTAANGGANGFGTIFKITPGGTLTTLYSFGPYPDGWSPRAGLMQASDGNFYVTTYYEGTNHGGTVFEITPGGTMTTLYSFCPRIDCLDGIYPYAGLVQGSDGNFYGTTNYGGADNDGTVFRISPGGTLTTLHSFDDADGYSPYAGLIQASDGNFYGTTQLGGANNRGTVFKITPGGTLTTLYSFCSRAGCADGGSPRAGLKQTSDGDFYGTTSAGGASSNAGTVFKITTEGLLTTLYSFCAQAGCNDREEPVAGLVQAADGNLYGTTYGAAGRIMMASSLNW